MKICIPVLLFALLLVTTLSCKKDEADSPPDNILFNTFILVERDGVDFYWGNPYIQMGNGLFVVNDCNISGQDYLESIGFGTFVDTDNIQSEIGDTNYLYSGFSHFNPDYDAESTEKVVSGYLIITSIDETGRKFEGEFQMTTYDSIQDTYHQFLNGRFASEWL